MRVYVFVYVLEAFARRAEGTRMQGYRLRLQQKLGQCHQVAAITVQDPEERRLCRAESFCG